MATITLKNVPRPVHVEIKRRAEKNHRSINCEIITCLESILGLRVDRAEELLARMDRVRSGLTFVLSEAEVQAAKREGRK